ncbi:hypothetical protein E5676_scaffold584G00340 [Cucumis melo var. makuwa]|uniref:Zf-RVT domain-containing protein n=2 Tax=Cucumis melo TaxID=3656 RepID=A0A5D3DH32_CUCMM|nr:hypothetical protein E5676_scaffold584G00340 [Cucumis melo var. makuwa]
MKEDTAMWRQVIRSIHGSETFDWHTQSKSGNSLRSPWVSISREWKKVEILAPFKLGNGRRVAFWADSWAREIPLKTQNSKLFKIALLPIGSVAAHWDSDTNSWAIVFRRLLKDEEIQDFQSLLLLSSRRMAELEDGRIWSLDALGHYSVKSLSTHLSPSCPLEKACYKALWKTSSLRRKNILDELWRSAFLIVSRLWKGNFPICARCHWCALFV